MRSPFTRVLVVAVCSMSLLGCGLQRGSDSVVASNSIRTVTVFAASSMNTLLTDLAQRYETSHPDVDIVLSFGASSTLATQVAEGAPANIFIAASGKAMTTAGERITDARDYVGNEVVVAVYVGDDSGVVVDNGAAAELDRVKTWVQCAHEVPCGAAADKAIATFGVKSTPVSLEPDAASAMAKVESGEVDAGIVYYTDARQATHVNIVSFCTCVTGSPEALAAVTTYRIGSVETLDAAAADVFAYLQSREALAAAELLGFTVPAT